ncbi:MAG: glycosyltransferase family 87 protein [Gaiellaceae bacterium]
MRLPRRDRGRPEGRWLALAALLLLAAALRLPGLRYGLPFPLLNPDEESIVPRAWELAHGGGLDPGWYDYPSLLFALLAPFQAFADEPSYLAGRVVAAAVGIGGVGAAWWLGRVAYGPLAAVVAGATVAVATVHVAYSHVAVTDVLLTTLVTVSLALAVQGRLEWAGVAAGLAASAKYPGLFLAAPLFAVGWRQWRRLATSAGLAVLAFVLTSPFVVWHAGAAWADVVRVQRLAEKGWLGFEHDHPTPIAFLDRLWESLGPALVVVLVGLALAVRTLVLKQHKHIDSPQGSAQPGRSSPARTKFVLQQHKLFPGRADLALAVFALVYFASLLTLNAHFDRYVLPLVPVLGALAGRARPLAALTLALLVVPLTWSIGDIRELSRTDTRLVAHDWIEEHVPRSSTVAVDPSTAPVDAARVIRLELPGPGRPADPNRDLAALAAQGVDYVVITGAVYDRVAAAGSDYPEALVFYDRLAQSTTARRVFDVYPGRRLAGPWVAVYRL